MMLVQAVDVSELLMNCCKVEIIIGGMRASMVARTRARLGFWKAPQPHHRENHVNLPTKHMRFETTLIYPRNICVSKPR